MELVILFGLTILNGLFAMSEMAIASARRTRLQSQADEGNVGAKKALELADSPNRFLSTVQIFITLISILQGVFGGQAFAESIANFITANIPALSDVAQPIGYAIVVGAIAYLSLVIGELVPKRLALQNAERIATLVSRPMSFMATITSPIVWLLSKSTNLIIRLLGVKKNDEASVTELEVMAMVEEGVSSGIFEETQQEMVQAVFRLDDQRIGSLITPRQEIIWLNLEDPKEDIIRIISENRFSTYPVGRGNVDNLVGLVQSKDILSQVISGKPLNLESIMCTALFIPESLSIADAIKQFKTEGVHTAFVLSEYGGIEGMVRMNSLIEQVFGELSAGNQTAQVSPDAVKDESGTWSFNGQYLLSRFGEHFSDFSIPSDETGKYETLAGFIMARLGRIPERTDTFEYQSLRFEVTNMENRRIDRVLVSSVSETKE
jgi:putative hemolysin